VLRIGLEERDDEEDEDKEVDEFGWALRFEEAVVLFGAVEAELTLELFEREASDSIETFEEESGDLAKISGTI
jgi:hypothetical protein